MLKSILRGWRSQGYLDGIQLLRNRSTFFMYAFSELILATASVSGMVLLASKFGGIGVWSRTDIFFLLGYALTVDSLLEMFFGYNIRNISRRIGRGQLDHLLVQPRPLWIALFTEGFSPFSVFLRLIPGGVLIGWAITQKPIEISPMWWGWFALNIVASVGVVLGYSFAWGSLAFWSPRGAEEICSSISRMFGQLQIFPLNGLGIITGGLLTILPIGFMAWFPARTLLTVPLYPQSLLITPIVSLCFLGLGLVSFVRGLAHYGRTGSQRYLDHGHRR